jgi:hypothetical protein
MFDYARCVLAVEKGVPDRPRGKERIMSGREKKREKFSTNAQNYIKKLEASVKKLERWFLAHMGEVQSRSGRKGSAKPRRDSAVMLEANCAVDLVELERKMDEKYSFLSAKEKELQELEKKIHAEVEKLLAEIKERDLLLAAREVELRNLKQGIASRLDELEGLVKRRTVGGRTARLVSFLVDIGKKH